MLSGFDTRTKSGAGCKPHFFYAAQAESAIGTNSMLGAFLIFLPSPLYFGLGECINNSTRPFSLSPNVLEIKTTPLNGIVCGGV